MNIYLKPASNLDTEVRSVQPCSGTRDEGWTACEAECLGHVDRYDRQEGVEEANDILYWMPYLAGSKPVAAWSSTNDPCVRGRVELRLVHNPTLFETGTGDPVPVWVLVVDDASSDARDFALALPSAASAQKAFQEEVEAAEDGCDCGRSQSA